MRKYEQVYMQIGNLIDNRNLIEKCKLPPETRLMNKKVILLIPVKK